MADSEQVLAHELHEESHGVIIATEAMEAADASVEVIQSTNQILTTTHLL